MRHWDSKKGDFNSFDKLQIKKINFILTKVQFSQKNIHTVGEKKDSTLHRAYGVKLPYLRAVWAGQGLILPLEKLTHFFLGPWLLVCQFIDISNQTETTGEVSDIERFFLYNRALYKFFC